MTDSMLEFDPIPATTIALSGIQIDYAMGQSHQCPQPAQQWQTYLDFLAMQGFEQWLRQRGWTQSFESVHSLTTCQLTVNQFRIAFIPNVSQPDSLVSVPRAIVDAPENPAHFYVLVSIYEEQGQVAIDGFLRHDQLQTHWQTQPQPLEVDHTYSFPLAWFDLNPDRLLLYLRCLLPTAMPPVEVAASPSSPTVPARLQPLMNAQLWLQNQLDAIAQEFAWVLLPSLTLSPGLRSTRGMPISLSTSVGAPSAGELTRSPLEEAEALLYQLARQGVVLPPQVGIAYRDWMMASIPLRLYAVSGEISEPGQPPEWMLLLLLGAQQGATLPAETTLLVRTATEIVVEQRLQTTTNADFLIAQVMGNRDESFTATISLPGGAALTLPPFGFPTD